jgi:ABC-type transport system involved in multi-copper enzyme maturation permease subunit
MRSFLSLLLFAFGICLMFAMITFVFFNGQIKGATSFWDYLHYAIGSLTTSDVGGMIPTTDAAQIWTAGYVLTVWVYIFWATLNHVRNIKFGRIG